ncbi:MAG TPA: sigma-70 family RNA polymerase sigma factor [Cytophagaceae bacterium]|nr:sigma-70 family RNA polymerase sigma factor [Cytophagaceae bacterium]
MYIAVTGSNSERVFFRKQHIKANFSDEELIDRYKNSGDTYYAGELFQRYSHLVLGVCMKYLKNEEESRDAVMNIFEKLLSDLKKHKISNFKSWLHTVSRNHCLMYLRANKKMDILFQETETEFMEMNDTLHLTEEKVSEEALGKLEGCIEKLVEEQKRCVHLFYIEEKCYKEVSEQTGYDMNKVKSYIQNGKRNLKLCMDDN